MQKTDHECFTRPEDGVVRCVLLRTTAGDRRGQQHFDEISVPLPSYFLLASPDWFRCDHRRYGTAPMHAPRSLRGQVPTSISAYMHE